MSLDDTIAAGFAAALETYQMRIVDLEQDLADSRDDFDIVEEERDELASDIRSLEEEILGLQTQNEQLLDQVREWRDKLFDIQYDMGNV